MLNKKCRIILRPQKKRKHNIPQGSFFVCLFVWFFLWKLCILALQELPCLSGTPLFKFLYTYPSPFTSCQGTERNVKKSSTFKKVITPKNYFYENLMANFPFFFLLAEGNVRIKFNVFVGCLCVCLNFFC